MSATRTNVTPCRPLMGRALLAVLLSLALASCPAEPEASGAPEAQGLVVLNPSGERPFYHLFGQVQEGETARHTFVLRNDDPRPMTILRIQTACGCTLPSLTVHGPDGEATPGRLLGDGPVALVPPGARVEVEFQIDSAHVPRKNAFWLATAHMLTDSPASAYVHFEMSIFVDAPLQITPAVIDLGDVPVSAGAWGQATVITAVAGAPLRVAGIAAQSPELAATLEERAPFGTPVWELRVELPPGLAMGPYLGEVELEVVDEPTAEAGSEAGEPRRRGIAVPVRGRVVEDIIARPGILRLGLGQGEGRIVSLVPGRRIVVELLAVEGVPDGLIEVELAPLGPDSRGRAQEWLVRLAQAGEATQARPSGSLRLRVDEAEGSRTLLVPFSAQAP